MGGHVADLPIEDYRFFNSSNLIHVLRTHFLTCQLERSKVSDANPEWKKMNLKRASPPRRQVPPIGPLARGFAAKQFVVISLLIAPIGRKKMTIHLHTRVYALSFLACFASCHVGGRHYVVFRGFRFEFKKDDWTAPFSGRVSRRCRTPRAIAPLRNRSGKQVRNRGREINCCYPRCSDGNAP